jgi:hypothetical protein
MLDGDGLLESPEAAALDAADTAQIDDFALLDVNPTSTTYRRLVSPRDYLGTVTGWYFGHAT